MNICPKCKRKYDDSWKVCLNCNLPLIDKLENSTEESSHQQGRPKNRNDKIAQKITNKDWIALIISFLTASFFMKFYMLGGFSWLNQKNPTEGIAFILGGALTISLTAIFLTFIFSRKIPLVLSSLLGFALICYLQSGHIYSKAREAGLPPKEASDSKNIFFFIFTIFAWGLFIGIQQIFKKYAQQKNLSCNKVKTNKNL